LVTLNVKDLEDFAENNGLDLLRGPRWPVRASTEVATF
jgi:hypothetical protein